MKGFELVAVALLFNLIACRKENNVIVVDTPLTEMDSLFIKISGGYSGEWKSKETYYNYIMDDPDGEYHAEGYDEGLYTAEIVRVGTDTLIVLPEDITYSCGSEGKMNRFKVDATFPDLIRKCSPTSDDYQLIELHFVGEYFDSLYIKTISASGQSDESSVSYHTILIDYCLAKD